MPTAKNLKKVKQMIRPKMQLLSMAFTLYLENSVKNGKQKILTISDKII